MKTIYKYDLGESVEVTIMLPPDAKVLSVGNQNNRMVMWVQLNTLETVVDRTFYVLGTGWKMDHIDFSKTQFIGTILLDGGSLAYHVFEALQ